MSVDDYILSLKSCLEEDLVSESTLDVLLGSPLWQEHELAWGLLVSCLRKKERTFPLPTLDQRSSGAVFLFKSGYFPWGPLPYPALHAELALILNHLGEKETAEKMAHWQARWIDHHGRPLHFLFQQEGAPRSHLETAFDQLIAHIPVEFQEEENFYDEDLGLCIMRKGSRTVAACATGCKSGVGAYFCEDAGVITCGPQLAPMGTCEGFGLAGKPAHMEVCPTQDGYVLSYQNKVAAPSLHQSDLATIKDSGFSNLWVDITHHITLNNAFISCQFEGDRAEQPLFTFFLKGTSLTIGKSQKMQPASLDRYTGPPAPICIQGVSGNVMLECLDGALTMEVIPLAGDEDYWGANFLVAYFPSASELKFSMTS